VMPTFPPPTEGALFAMSLSRLLAPAHSF